MRGRSWVTTMMTTVLLTMVWSGPLSAQQRVVTGTVVAARTGNPLSSAAIQVVGANETVNVDPQGNFRIQVPAGDQTLRITFFGYLARTVPVPSAAVTSARSAWRRTSSTSRASW